MKEFTLDNEYRFEFNEKLELWDVFQNEVLLPKSTDRLFKYYSLSINSIDCVLRSYFYLANPGSFNDPFDCNINLIKDALNPNQKKSNKRNSYNNIGICSFSETIDNHLMWAHYTNNYNGFALGFDGEDIQIKLNKKFVERYTLTKVLYPKQPIQIEQDLPISLHYILSTKFKHWEYEKEWRIITQIKNQERDLEYFPECLKGFYIGHKIPDENPSAYKLLIEIQVLKYPTTPVYVVYPHSTDLRLEFERVWS